MNQRGSHLENEATRAVARRLREIGLLLLDCDMAGHLNSRPLPGTDWLSDLFCLSRIFRGALREAAGEWKQLDEPTGLEMFPGCWLYPMPRVSRRRRIGYAVVVIFTEAFLDCEQLSAMCQSVHTDFELTRRRLAELPPVGEEDVERLAVMISDALADHVQLATNDQAMETVGQQLAESYEEISLLYSITQSMTVVQRPSRFVTLVCEELLGTLPYGWVAALLGEDRDRLKKLAGLFTVSGEANQPVETLKPLVQDMLSLARPEMPLVLEPATNQEHARFAGLGNSVLAHPISRDDRVIGLLVAGQKQGPDLAVSSVDMKLLGATATHMAIFLENAALYDDLNAMFLGTLEALTASIDAKDRYTSGHSRRVAHLTQKLAKAIGLPEYTISRMRIAGLVHDVGKIGVPEAVLCKPGKLTEEEFDLIRKHPEIGHRILKDIPQLKDILPGVLYHHERWDGKGYPHGLAQQQIPMVARLIALADSFDAMSSTRTYRQARSRSEVLREIRQCAGTQFDPDLAPVFSKLDFSGYDRLVAELGTAEDTVVRARDNAA